MTRPVCPECQRPYHVKARIPVDPVTAEVGMCRDCRDERAVALDLFRDMPAEARLDLGLPGDTQEV